MSTVSSVYRYVYRTGPSSPVRAPSSFINHLVQIIIRVTPGRVSGCFVRPFVDAALYRSVSMEHLLTAIPNRLAPLR